MTKWLEQIMLADLWDAYADDTLPFEQVRDQTVARLRASEWAKRSEDVPDYINDYLAVAEDIEEFDGAWSILLDMADADKVWLETMLLR